MTMPFDESLYPKRDANPNGFNGLGAAVAGDVSVPGVVDRGGATVQTPSRFEMQSFAPLVFQLASVADDFSPWGANQPLRDQQLRSFWPTESFLASAIYSIVARNSAFSWTLEGPPRTVKVVQDRLHMSDLGNGWQQFIMKVTTDLLTQDAGAFIEIIRSGPNEGDQVLGLAHLDAAQCRRTGVPEFPVVYTSPRTGIMHKLRPWQVIAWAEFPSPVETMNGTGLCAVSRVLRMAQFLRDIAIYQREKVAGRNPQAIYFVSGINASVIDDAVAANGQRRDAQGAARFTLPVVMGSVDPTASIGVERIDLASLPDGFDVEVTMKWYIVQLALAFGADYQDFAPLSTGSMGSSAQSLTLHMKSRGKGPALFMKGMEYWLNFHGILPASVTFKYDEQDAAGDMENAELRKLRAEARKLDVESGVLTPEGARQLMLDDGDLSPELFDAMQIGQDLTSDVTVADNDPTEATTGGPGADAPNAPGNRIPDERRGGVNVTVNNLPGGQRSRSKNSKASEDEGDVASDFANDERVEWEEDMQTVMARALRRTFADLRSRLNPSKSLTARLFFFTGKKEEPFDVEQDAEFWLEFRTRMVGEMLPFVREVANGAAAYSQGLGLAVNMDMVNQQVLEFSRTYTNAWWDEIEDTTRKGLRTAITTWQETGLGDRGLPDLVDSLEPLFGQARAQRIAVTEVTRLFNEGNKLAYASAGLNTVEFQTSRDDVVCPVCRPLDGVRMALQGAETPPLHVNCRCALLPVANDDTLRG